MEEDKKNVGIIISLIIFIIISVALGLYLVYDKVIIGEENYQINVEEKNDEEDEKQEGTLDLINYDINSIKNVEVSVPVLGASDPEMRTTTIDNKEEIKEILLNVDKKEEINNFSNEIGFIDNVTITINYEGDPSTEIIILDNGNLAINSAVGVGETGYVEYKIENKDLALELTNKYQTKE